MTHSNVEAAAGMIAGPGLILVVFSLTSDPLLTLLLVIGLLMIAAAGLIWVGARKEASTA
ncbi:MAG: Poxvirus P21 membrane protein [Rhodobacteraceae bacterium HLUCCA08]|nr:MAG: Poxvirus P21 membrane protein [Rhodobacteraceae bacterium HLUCCA08]